VSRAVASSDRAVGGSSGPSEKGGQEGFIKINTLLYSSGLATSAVLVPVAFIIPFATAPPLLVILAACFVGAVVVGLAVYGLIKLIRRKEGAEWNSKIDYKKIGKWITWLWSSAKAGLWSAAKEDDGCELLFCIDQHTGSVYVRQPDGCLDQIFGSESRGVIAQMVASRNRGIPVYSQ